MINAKTYSFIAKLFLLYSLPHENRDAALISNYHMLLQLLRPYKL